MAAIRVLHIASFLGNVGDNINHLGLYECVKRQLSWEFEFTQLEMRKFFRKEQNWDLSLVNYINSFDLCIIGGGNYFELWVEQSPTGTSVGLSPDLLSLTTTPIIFHALGCDDGMGCSPSAVGKFAEFIDYIQRRPQQFLISLRNDGSAQTFREQLGAVRASSTLECPDCGFFYTSSRPCAPGLRSTIGINMAGDMLDQRFGGAEHYQKFIKSWAQLLASITSQYNVGITFFCHIFKDLRIVTDILHLLPDRISRELIRIAPYGQGVASAEEIFGEYHSCSLILANRFHANVYPLANGIPVIPLINYPQIERLYRDLGTTTPTIALTSEGIEEAHTTIREVLVGGTHKLQVLQSSAMIRVREQGKRYFSAVDSWLRAGRIAPKSLFFKSLFFSD